MTVNESRKHPFLRLVLISVLSISFLLLSDSLYSEAFVTPRARPGHPSQVTGLHVIRKDHKLNQLILGWNPNKKSEGVDKYAIYTEVYVQPPLTSALKIVSGNSVTLTLSNFLGGTGGKTDRIFWVIGHNKFGWGVNDRSAADPDQNPNQFDPYRTSPTDDISALQLHYLDVFYK